MALQKKPGLPHAANRACVNDVKKIYVYYLGATTTLLLVRSVLPVKRCTK